MKRVFIVYTDVFRINLPKTSIPIKILKHADRLTGFQITGLRVGDPGEFVDDMKKRLAEEEETFRDSIVFMHQKAGAYMMISTAIRNRLKTLNVKTVFWMDDVHFPVKNRHDLSTHRHDVEREPRFVHMDRILTPSIKYFENIKSTLLQKSEFFPYCFDEDLIDRYDPSKQFDKRKNVVLISGKISRSYWSRKLMMREATIHPDLYEILQHPGYEKKGAVHDLTGSKYYDELSKYKAAMLGLSNYPLDFHLAKLVEILGSGCIGIFEQSTEYERLGLKPYVHYIPIKKGEDGRMIFETDYYRRVVDSDEGRKIAEAGYNAVKSRFTTSNMVERFHDVLKRLTCADEV